MYPPAGALYQGFGRSFFYAELRLPSSGISSSLYTIFSFGTDSPVENLLSFF